MLGGPLEQSAQQPLPFSSETVGIPTETARSPQVCVLKFHPLLPDEIVVVEP